MGRLKKTGSVNIGLSETDKTEFSINGNVVPVEINEFEIYALKYLSIYNRVIETEPKYKKLFKEDGLTIENWIEKIYNATQVLHTNNSNISDGIFDLFGEIKELSKEEKEQLFKLNEIISLFMQKDMMKNIIEGFDRLELSQLDEALVMYKNLYLQQPTNEISFLVEELKSLKEKKTKEQNKSKAQSDKALDIPKYETIKDIWKGDYSKWFVILNKISEYNFCVKNEQNNWSWNMSIAKLAGFYRLLRKKGLIENIQNDNQIARCFFLFFDIKSTNYSFFKLSRKETVEKYFIDFPPF
jgi:hypothetical protein